MFKLKTLLFVVSVLFYGTPLLPVHKKHHTQHTKKKTQKKVHIRNFSLKYDSGFLLRAYKAEYDYLVGGIGNSIPLKEVLKDRLKDSIKMLAVGNKTAGVIAYNKKGEITLVYVHPSFRGKGYGAYLLKYAKRALVKRKLKQAKLEVFDYNYAAIRAFKKAGFIKKGKKGRLLSLCCKL